MDLTAPQARVIGCLIEKALTTPQQYPLTLNALVAACNQTSNREPVVAYDDRTVEDAVQTLKEQGLVRFVHPSHGRSATRYRHVLDEALGLETPALALVAVLVLRGAQTIGELRGRTERMATFESLADVERQLDELAAAGDPLVERLPRRLGQKEVRYRALLGPEPEPGADDGVVERPPPARHSLADEVEALRAEVAELRAAVEELRAGLGG